MKLLMKLGIIMLALIVGFTILIPQGTANASGENINSVESIHEIVVKNKLAEVTKDGQIVIKINALDIGVSQELFDSYLNDMEKINFAVREGLMYFKENLKLVTLSQEEIQTKLLNENKKNPKNLLVENGLIQPFGYTTGYPVWNVKALVIQNRRSLESVMASALAALKYGGGDPYLTTVGYWVGKVQENGAWDYKSVPGYSPYNKVWETYFWTSGYEVHDTAYVGNYNYAFTGEYLFSKSALLTGGDAVSLYTSQKPDGEEDKIPIRRGFDDAVRYY